MPTATRGTGAIEIVGDTSVVLKWFRGEGESELPAARALLAAHGSSRVTVSIIDLTLYELGNVLVRARRWAPEQAIAQLEDLEALCPVISPGAAERRIAAELTAERSLTFYDAVCVATARLRSWPFVTADRALVFEGGGETVTSPVERLGLA